MNVYLVYIPSSGATARNLLERDFPLRYDLQPGVLWVVASNLETPLAVCQQLGLTASQETTAPDRNSGVVVSFDRFYGMYDPGLWQAVESWNKGG